MWVRLDQHFLLMYELKVNKCLPLASLGYPQCAMSSPQGLILLSCDMCAKPPIEIDNLFSLPLFESAFSHHLLLTPQLRHFSSTHHISSPPSDDTLPSDDRRLNQAKSSREGGFTFSPLPPLSPAPPPYLGPSRGKKLIQSSHVRPNDTCPNKG